jgi:hypothetical protein
MSPFSIVDALYHVHIEPSPLDGPYVMPSNHAKNDWIVTIWGRMSIDIIVQLEEHSQSCTIKKSLIVASQPFYYLTPNVDTSSSCIAIDSLMFLQGFRPTSSSSNFLAKLETLYFE